MRKEKMNNRRATASGFSLIEISIVVMIIGVLVLGALGGYQYLERAKRNTTITNLKNVKLAIESFRADTGSYPQSLTELKERPSNEKISKKWQGPYLPGEPVDGYNTELMYKLTKGEKHPYELYSWGANGEGSPQEEWVSVWD
jgi:general secretion pathway protein G